MTTSARNPRAEAQSLVGEEFEARVLEPSPPAVNDGPYFADDPIAVEPGGAGADSADSTLPQEAAHTSPPKVLVPQGLNGDLGWTDWLGVHPAHSDWVTSQWLGGFRHLPATPLLLTPTRLALHRLGAYVIAPARHAANGKFGLRWTSGGFGTPFFSDDTAADRQIRVEGTTLIDQRDAEVRTAPITTLRAAADFLGSAIDADTAAEHDSPELGDVDEQLTVDADASAFLGAWYGMGFAALELLRADDGSIDSSRPQLWPGHFDPAIEVGDEDHRGSYGASPGDSDGLGNGIDEPYLYVSIWWPDRIGFDESDPAWNAPSFKGAILKLSDFPEGRDVVEVAHGFFATARDRIG